MSLDCLIIGAGPAGLSAGIYLRRFHREVRLFDSGSSRASLIPRAFNYPGFPDGISGNDFLDRLRAQFVRYGGKVINAEINVLNISEDNTFCVQTGGETILAKTVLLATGIIDIEPSIPGFSDVKSEELIRFCPICDGFEFTEQHIGIIGAGEHGVREAEFIREYTRHLSLIYPGSNSDVDPGLLRRLDKNNINLITGEVRRLSTESGRTIRLEMEDNTEHNFDVLYCALGTHPQSELAIKLGASHDSQNCLLVDEHLQTSIPGMYAAGDVVSGLDQLAVAAGHAAIAATAIHNSLSHT